MLGAQPLGKKRKKKELIVNRWLACVCQRDSGQCRLISRLFCSVMIQWGQSDDLLYQTASMLLSCVTVSCVLCSCAQPGGREGGGGEGKNVVLVRLLIEIKCHKPLESTYRLMD